MSLLMSDGVNAGRDIEGKARRCLSAHAAATLSATLFMTQSQTQANTHQSTYTCGEKCGATLRNASDRILGTH